MSSHFGLTSSQIFIINTELKELLKLSKNYKVYVFGSRAKNTQRKYSDLDLWIDSDPQLTNVQLALFLEKIEATDLPIKIDVVTAENCLAEYKSRIMSERVEWVICG